jgi:hypothetical protein
MYRYPLRVIYQTSQRFTVPVLILDQNSNRASSATAEEEEEEEEEESGQFPTQGLLQLW